MDYLIDVDGVCGKFAEALLDAIKPEFPQEKMVEWDILKGYFNEDERRRATHLLARPEFWADLDVVDGAQDAIKTLRGLGHSIKWVTAPWVSCPSWETVREQWIHRNFPGSDGEPIEFRADKEKVDGDRMVDDRPSNIEDWQRAHPEGKAFLFRTQFNQTVHPPYVMENGWQDLRKIL